MVVRCTERLLLQLLPGATATTTEPSTIRVTTPTGGVLRRTMQQTHGTANSTTITTMQTETTTIRSQAFLFVV